jgi:hypothetical protein
MYKSCAVCFDKNLTPKLNTEGAWELVGLKCDCERCKICEEEEPEYFDQYLNPHRFETEPRVKCKIPRCNYHKENKKNGLCSSCSEGNIVNFNNRHDPMSERFKKHLYSSMVLECLGNKKFVIGKTSMKSDVYMTKEITPFDAELINDFGWVKSDDITIAPLAPASPAPPFIF